MDILEDNVSRETMDKLGAFSALVVKWTAKINLISKNTTSEIWDRHIIDSAQVFQNAPSEGHWVDLGSGGGFPGIVASVLSDGENGSHTFTLVESDQRKSVFLRTAVRELELNATILTDRIENIECLEADILSARALADLDVLLSFAQIHMKSDGLALFPKGQRWEKEDENARGQWSYSCDPVRSITNPNAAILKIKDIARV